MFAICVRVYYKEKRFYHEVNSNNSYSRTDGVYSKRLVSSVILTVPRKKKKKSFKCLNTTLLLSPHS